MTERGGTKTALSPTTQEFGYLEYQLQLALHSSTARITNAYVVSNPHLNVQFDRRCKDILTVSSFLDSGVLVGVNTEEEVIRRGFQFPPGGVQGMKIPVGSMKRSLRSFKGRDTKIVRKILFCKVGIGRSYVSDELSAENQCIPEGYDSLYLRDTSAQYDASKPLQDDNLVTGTDYYHEYFVKNPCQILPQYLIHYEFDPTKEKKSREVPKCDNCEEQCPATVYCAADEANLCNKCDAKLHETKVASRHVRTPIGKGGDIFGQCRLHPKKMIEYVCSQCHIPVCITCKMVGNHANGEAAKHPLVSVAEAYHTVMQEASMMDPVLQSRRTEVNNQIAAVNSRAKAVEKMAHQIQSQIDEMHRRGTEELKSIIRKKMDTLLGDELELRRQLGETERLEEFLKYQQSGDPTHFLFSWARHQKIRSELHDFRFFRDEIDVHLDVKVTGGIAVTIDHAPAPAHHPTTLSHSLVKKPMKTASALPVAQAPLAIGMGMPQKMQDRRIQRRTSDFFAETLGAFDQFGVHEGDEDYDYRE